MDRGRRFRLVLRYRQDDPKGALPLSTPEPGFELRRVARRITFTLFSAQSLGSAGFLAASTINAIVGAKLSGHLAWAGAPSATYPGGAALAAFVWGYPMDRLGRRSTLTLGGLAGAVGAAL
ncbi:MAG TPA: hypothetical protein VI589_06235, partial [Vicinamibacteria bacterium]